MSKKRTNLYQEEGHSCKSDLYSICILPLFLVIFRVLASLPPYACFHLQNTPKPTLVDSIYTIYHVRTVVHVPFTQYRDLASSWIRANKFHATSTRPLLEVMKAIIIIYSKYAYQEYELECATVVDVSREVCLCLVAPSLCCLLVQLPVVPPQPLCCVVAERVFFPLV